MSWINLSTYLKDRPIKKWCRFLLIQFIKGSRSKSLLNQTNLSDNSVLLSHEILNIRPRLEKTERSMRPWTGVGVRKSSFQSHTHWWFTLSSLSCSLLSLRCGQYLSHPRKINNKTKELKHMRNRALCEKLSRKPRGCPLIQGCMFPTTEKSWLALVSACLQWQKGFQ